MSGSRTSRGTFSTRPVEESRIENCLKQSSPTDHDDTIIMAGSSKYFSTTKRGPWTRDRSQTQTDSHVFSLSHSPFHTFTRHPSRRASRVQARAERPGSEVAKRCGTPLVEPLGSWSTVSARHPARLGSLARSLAPRLVAVQVKKVIAAMTVRPAENCPASARVPPPPARSLVRPSSSLSRRSGRTSLRSSLTSSTACRRTIPSSKSWCICT